jgi:peroxiredoxin Q/BCP
MIDPPKATKGRRMSKEPHKKPSKPKRPAKTATGAVANKAVTKAATTVPAASTKAKAGTRPKGAAAVSARSVAASKTAAKAAKSPVPATKTAASGKAAPAPAMPRGLKEGDKAPAFALPRDGGGTVSLGDVAGKNLVLFFYPRANTPGCTREAIDFTRLAKEFATSGTTVLGVSADTVKAQDSFRDKHALAFPLLSDSTHDMLEAYGAWGEKSLYGRKFLGIIRSTILIGKDGRIAKIWRNVKVDGHADAVLAAARSL